MGDTSHRREVDRGRTAISRTDLSRPLKCAIVDGLVNPDTRIFDYGCGRGDDIRRLTSSGYRASGWDPNLRLTTEQPRSEVVNRGYVVNVIEDVDERSDVLREAWALAD